jgi:hypothetical protein
MKLIILRNDCNGQMLPISEGIVEIRINSQPCRGINLTTRRTQARRAPRVSTIHNVTKNSGQVSPRPSVVFHAYASVDTPWVARTPPHCTPVKYGGVSSNLATIETTQVGDPKKSRMCQYIIKDVDSDPTDADLNWHRQGLPPWSSEFTIQTTRNLPI